MPLLFVAWYSAKCIVQAQILAKCSLKKTPLYNFFSFKLQDQRRHFKNWSLKGFGQAGENATVRGFSHNLKNYSTKSSCCLFSHYASTCQHCSQWWRQWTYLKARKDLLRGNVYWRGLAKLYNYSSLVFCDGLGKLSVGVGVWESTVEVNTSKSKSYGSRKIGE